MIDDPFMLNQYYFQSPPRYYKSDTFPTTPVDPSKLAEIVVSRLRTYGNAIPNDTPTMIQQVCRTFNECIRINREQDMPSNLILSPKTGAGKSTIAKTYVSILENHTSVIIVPRVSDAIEFCKDINNYREDSSYARCIYKVNEVNPDEDVRIEIKDINKYPCIVMTHKMLEVASNYDNNPVSKILAQKPRDLVIVDERLQLKDPKSVYYSEVSSFQDYLKRIKKDYPSYKLNEPISQLDKILQLFNELEDISASIQKNIVSMDYLLETNYENVSPVSLEEITRLFRSDLNLSQLYNPANKQKSDSYEAKFRSDWLSSLNTLNIIVQDFFYFYKSGTKKSLNITNNIRGLFDSLVVLDATAEVNEYYNTLSYTKNMTVQHIETVNPRKYNNLTFHLCPGIAQGKSSISNDDAKKYINIAESLVTEDDDKLLVVSHKDFVAHLKGLNHKENIYFTNWGNHIGKNEWSECNKVLIIGWYFLPKNAHYNNLVLAVGAPEYVEKIYTDYTLETYSTTQIADDLVQAIMRCRARVISDSDGNCMPAEIYMFSGRNKIDDDPSLNLVFKQFQGAYIKQWAPSADTAPRKKAQAQKNIDIIIEYLKRIENETIDVSQATIVKNTPLTKSVVSRLYSDERFEEALNIHSYSKCRINGKSTGVRLRP